MGKLFSSIDNRPRHPGDIIRMFLASLVFASTTILAITTGVAPLEEAVFRVVNILPSFISPLVQVIMQFGALFFVFVACIYAMFFKHYRLSLKILFGGVGVWVAAKIAKALVERERPFYILNEIVEHASNSGILGFPSGHASVAALLATVSSPYLSLRWRRVIWIAAWITALGRVYVGAHLPLDIIAGMSLGWFAGSLLNFAFGTPKKHIPFNNIRKTLSKAGLALSYITEANVDSRGSVPIFATTKTGKKLFIKLIDNEHRNADLLYRLWRFITMREVEDEAPLATAKQYAEHEAYLAIQADQAGVRVPKVLLASPVISHAAVIVTEKIEGNILSKHPEDIDEKLLTKLWSEIDKLHKYRIAHRDLRASNIMIDNKNQPVLIDFSFSQTAASDVQINKDLVEMLTSLSLLTDMKLVVKTAKQKFGTKKLKKTIPYVQPLALSSYTRKKINESDEILKKLVAELKKQTDSPITQKVNLSRINFRWLGFIVFIGLVLYYLIPHLGELDDSITAFKSADTPYIFLALLASILTYIMSSIAVIGATTSKLAFGRTFIVQFATTMVNRITPKGIGGAVLIEQYYERSGLSRIKSTAAISLLYSAGVIVHLLLTVFFILLVDPSLFDEFEPGEAENTLAIVVVAVIGLSLFYIPHTKKFIKKWGKETINSIQTISKLPLKLLQLFGGSAGITLAYGLAFSFSIEAFGAGISFQEAMLVYLGASIIASAAPTPGGLGAAEAALAVGLSLIDVPIGEAITAVLAFRLITFWLPIIPGVFALRYLTKKSILI